MPLGCFAYACEHKTDDAQAGKTRLFHRLPKNVGLAKEWIRLARPNADKDLKRFGSVRLCSDHFHPSQYHGTRLINDAVPSIFSWSDDGCKESEESAVIPSSTVESDVPFGTHDERVSVLTTEPSDTDDKLAYKNPINSTSSSVISSTQTRERVSSTIIDMNNICRLCSKNVEDALMSMDANDSSNDSLKLKIQKLLPFIDLDDELPKHICNHCVNTIISFYDISETSREREANKRTDLSFSDTKNILNVSQEDNERLDLSSDENNTNSMSIELVNQEDNERLDLSSDENNINSTSIELVTQPLTLNVGDQNTSETALSGKNVEDTPEVLCETIDSIKVTNVTSECLNEIIEDTSEIICVTEHVSNAIVSERSEEEELKICLIQKLPVTNSKLKVQNSDKTPSTRLHDILGKIAHRISGSEPNEEEAEGKEKDDDQDSVESNPNLLDDPMQPSLVENHDHVPDQDYHLTPIVIDDEHSTNEYTIEQTYATWEAEQIATNVSNTTVATQLPFPCDMCPCSYATKRLLAKHESIMHPLPDADLKCDTCTKSFTTITDLIFHQCAIYDQLRVDIGDGKFRYQCDRCPYNTPSSSQYYLSVFQKHYEKHTTTEVQDDVQYESRPYKCSQCDKTYINYRTLKLHQKVHLNGRQFECNDCGKKFLYKCKVAEHIKFVHQREWNHRCPDCNKPFSTASKMKIHMVRHMANYKHVCDLCDKRFFTEDWLIEHIRFVHPASKPRFVCSLCGEAYVLKNSLDMHCRKVHVNDPMLPEGNLPQSSLLKTILRLMKKKKEKKKKKKEKKKEKKKKEKKKKKKKKKEKKKKTSAQRRTQVGVLDVRTPSEMSEKI